VTETASIFGPIAQDIPRIGEYLRGLAKGHHPLLGETLAHIFETSGKRIRPALVLLSGHLGAYDPEALTTLAASLEVVHTASLVHDDTIDQAMTRRGLKTINSVWDSKVAILVGDFLFAQSAELAARLDSVRIMTLLSETVMSMTSGELRQYASSREHLIDENDYLLRIGGKTASLFSMCCQGAAIVSGQSDERVAALRSYGQNLGIAYQIGDDVLDFEGSEATLGKPAGGDLAQGTITLPVILLAAELEHDSTLFRDLERGENIDAVVNAVRESGALDRSRDRARQYAAAARADLQTFPRSDTTEALNDLTEYVIRRDR
jgi:geranylgeranyl pyrophosphate synthase